MTTTPAGTSRTEQLHRLFRGTAELTKRLRQIALLLEIVAAGVAAWGTLAGSTLWGGWASLVMLLLLVGGTALRIWSRSTHAYAERCRRVSARAWALGQTIGASVHSSILSDTPVFAERLAGKLPAGSMTDYYEPTRDVGRDRLRELYAHSSFYSWRLLRRGGWIFMGVGVAIAIVGAVIVFGLALPSTTVSAADRILDVVCSLVFAVLLARSLDAAIAAFISAQATRAISRVLIEAPDQERVEELIGHYDMERMSGPMIPTFVYRLSRDRLQAEWHERRKALDELT